MTVEPVEVLPPMVHLTPLGPRGSCPQKSGASLQVDGKPGWQAFLAHRPRVGFSAAAGPAWPLLALICETERRSQSVLGNSASPCFA